MNEDQVESLLRQAPQPTPPDDLLERLRSDISLPKRATNRGIGANAPNWWRIWLPVTAAVLALISGVGLLAGQMESLASLREENRMLHERAALQVASPVDSEMRRILAENEELPRLRKEREEVDQLRQEITRLRAQMPEITRLRNENQQLAASPSVNSLSGLAERFDPPIEEGALSSAQKCAINLKQLGIAFQLWAGDHRDLYPSNVLEMKASFTEYLKSPTILICPSDSVHIAAQNWSVFTEQNLTYRPGPGASQATPDVVMFYCPIHNRVLMSDGSTRALGPEQNVVLRDGKWYVASFSQP